jgi:hypothetical protein
VRVTTPAAIGNSRRVSRRPRDRDFEIIEAGRARGIALRGIGRSLKNQGRGKRAGASLQIMGALSLRLRFAGLHPI